jgi:hypothetical protein
MANCLLVCAKMDEVLVWMQERRRLVEATHPSVDPPNSVPTLPFRAEQ